MTEILGYDLRNSRNRHRKTIQPHCPIVGKQRGAAEVLQSCQAWECPTSRWSNSWHGYGVKVHHGTNRYTTGYIPFLHRNGCRRAVFEPLGSGDLVLGSARAARFSGNSMQNMKIETFWNCSWWFYPIVQIGTCWNSNRHPWAMPSRHFQNVSTFMLP